MKLFVLLGILFSLPSFAGFDPETEDYIPTFECTKESLNKDIDQYLLDTWVDDFKEGFFEKEKQKEDRPIIQIIKDYADRTWSVKEELDQINYKAYLAYIKQCDNFTDFVSEQELGHPDILGKQKLFAVEKNLLYILRVVTKEKDIETLKKLINQGLDIDVLFELTERRGLPYMDDSPPSYNIYGWMDVNKEDSKEEALAKNAFQRLLIELGSKGRDVDYRSI